MDQNEPQMRLRMQIGDNQLDVDGPVAAVREVLVEWRRLIGVAEPSPAPETSMPAPQSEMPQPAAVTPEAESGAPAPPQLSPALAALVVFDREQGVHVLRHLPRGRLRNAEAATLLLHAFELQNGDAESGMSSQKLQAALQASGLRFGRLDHILTKFLAAGIIIKVGSRRHERYALSVRGRQRAAHTADVLSRSTT